MLVLLLLLLLLQLGLVAGTEVGEEGGCQL
jgi:hypothetical protein